MDVEFEAITKARRDNKDPKLSDRLGGWTPSYQTDMYHCMN